MSDPRISDPQCRTIRETVINFKSNEIWRDNYRGDTIRESGTIRENTVIIPIGGQQYLSKNYDFLLHFQMQTWKGFLAKLIQLKQHCEVN